MLWPSGRRIGASFGFLYYCKSCCLVVAVLFRLSSGATTTTTAFSTPRGRRRPLSIHGPTSRTMRTTTTTTRLEALPFGLGGVTESILLAGGDLASRGGAPNTSAATMNPLTTYFLETLIANGVPAAFTLLTIGFVALLIGRSRNKGDREGGLGRDGGFNLKANTPVAQLYNDLYGRLLGVSALKFVQRFCSHTLGPDDDDDGMTWVRLRNREDGSCILLDRDTNYCQIYEARPVQCRTYPFWPTLTRSTGQWNGECRRTDDDSESDLPAWSPEIGGCEGMRPIGIVDGTSSSLSNTDQSNDGQEETCVPAKEALKKLFEYRVYERRFPTSGNPRPVPSDDDKIG